MSGPATGKKVPQPNGFRDLSDYARPAAVWIARRLRDTRIIAPDVTIAFGIVGLAGAVCYATGSYTLALLGAAAMQLKNVLDAVDGSLARIRAHPSRIGRFLDSLTDAGVAAALYAALGFHVAGHRPPAYAIALAAAALLASLLQGSVFNYYYLLYRARRGGDMTSRIHERLTEADEAYYWDRPIALRILKSLIRLYSIVYGWQDRLVEYLDERARPPVAGARLEISPGFLTAVSALGPGLQILVLDVYTVGGYFGLGLALELFLWTVALGGTAYAAGLFLWLRRRSRPT